MAEVHYRIGSDYPVLSAYMQCRAPVSFVRGPLGCTSGDTEFLTPTGWKRMDAYEPGDLVAQWRQGGAIEFVRPEAYIVEPCEELIWFHQGNLSMQLSEEHRMPLYNYRGRFGVYLAGEIEDHPSRYSVPVNFTPAHPDAPVSDDLIRLAVAINADGHHPRAGFKSEICVRKERKKERLRALLSALGIAYKESVSELRPTEARFYFVSPYRGKRYEGWHWWQLSARQLSVVLDEMSYWDGLHEGRETRFHSTHKVDADFMQYAAHAVGGTATIRRVESENEKWSDLWCVYVAQAGSAKAARNLRIDTTKVERIRAERKYCFTVPTGFFMARHADCVFVTGNSGKTIGTVQRILDQMCEQQPNAAGERRSRWLAIRNTYSDLRETTIKDFTSVFEPLGSMRWDDPPQFNARFRIEDGTLVLAEVIFLALDRPDSVRKLKGYQITGVWLNELSELDKAVVDMADLRHGRYPSEVDGGSRPTWHGMLGDTNSYDTTHWLYKFELRPPDGWECFIQPGGVRNVAGPDEAPLWQENPEAENLANLPDGYYRRGMQGKADSWIKVMLANEHGFTVHGKPVHPAFLHSRHVARQVIEADPKYELLIGMDFGRTPAAALLQFWEPRGRYVVVGELCSEDMSAAIFAPELKRTIDRKWPGFRSRGWGDPAGDAQGQATESTPIDICRAAGLPIVAAPSNIPALRRAAIDNPLMRSCFDGGPGLLVSPNCERVIKALMGGYHYRQIQVSGPEPRYSDTPEKNMDSHIAEALEYGLLGAGEGRAALQPAEPQLRRVRAREPEYSELGW